MQPSLKTIDDLRGPAGRLEALLNTGAADAPFAVLVLHPHPLGGGTMHNKVVYHTMKAFQSLGLPVLRFNFRGTGLSEGAYDHARGEQDDARAALDWLEGEYHLPVLLAGFSFGSYVGLRVACTDDRVKAVVGLGLPVHAEGRDYRYEFLSGCHKPKLFISGTQDQFGPKEMVAAEVEQAAPPNQMVWIDGAEHFFIGRLDEVRDAIVHWCNTQILTQVTS